MSDKEQRLKKGDKIELEFVGGPYPGRVEADIEFNLEYKDGRTIPFKIIGCEFVDEFNKIKKHLKLTDDVEVLKWIFTRAFNANQ